MVAERDEQARAGGRTSRQPQQGRDAPAGELGRVGAAGHEGRVPTQEDLLAEQQLSKERQQQGRGWMELEPGESSGTTPRADISTEELKRARGDAGSTGVTPSAARAEHEGETARRKLPPL